jgi:hypothetical protein
MATNGVKCGVCNADIVTTDNQVNLDWPAVPWSEHPASWTLMKFGNQVWATNGDPSPEGMGHTLHEHQPEGSVMDL